MKIFFLRKRLIWIAVPLCLALSWAGGTVSRSESMQGKIIIVDAGHGGIDPGANRPGVKEKDINLAISQQLKTALNHYGAKVVLSRQIDTDLSGECDNDKIRDRYHRDLTARLEMVEESDADMFISIHANAVHNARRHGAETFYYKKSDTGKELADAIQTELSAELGAKHQAQAANYFVLRRNHIPAALVEVGYITNREELTLLQTEQYQQRIAETIAHGIFNYYKYH